MPNTLAHFAVNAAITGFLPGKPDLKWILLGAVIPDVPFIIKRALVFTDAGIDVLDLRLLAIVQASLLFSLLLALAFSLLSKQPLRAFLILGVGVLAHLLLDASQTKWGNGPVFLAPFDWSYTNFELFWPEQWPSYVLTLLGVLYIICSIRYGFPPVHSDLDLRDKNRAAAALLVFGSYLLLPFALMDEVEESGAGRVQQIRAASRAGSMIEIDRARYRTSGNELQVELYSGYFIRLSYDGEDLAGRGKVSIKGRFLGHELLHADAYHINNPRFRELASIAGIAVASIYWLAALFGYARRES